MSRFLVVCALVVVFAASLTHCPAWAQSPRARALRHELGYVPYTPPKAFLDGYFIADETKPAFLFGPVADFAASRTRTCPTAWLIESDEKQRLAQRDPANPVFEYSLVLEQDCPGVVTDFVFVDQSAMNPRQWIEWRRKFHKNKAEPEYADAVARLEKAIAAGFPVSGEMRFVLRNGQLDPASPQTLLPKALSCPPRYDCQAGQPVQ